MKGQSRSVLDKIKMYGTECSKSIFTSVPPLPIVEVYNIINYELE